MPTRTLHRAPVTAKVTALGVHTVTRQVSPAGQGIRVLYHGTTTHGAQRLGGADRCRPMTYYAPGESQTGEEVILSIVLDDEWNVLTETYYRYDVELQTYGELTTDPEGIIVPKVLNVEADGYACVREPRQSLMRRAITSINGDMIEIRLRNISAMGALVECSLPVAPGTQLTIDIVGVGPMVGTVRWAQANRFGMKFEETFETSRLAPRPQKLNEVTMLSPWHKADRGKATG